MYSYDKFAGGHTIIRVLQFGGHFLWSRHRQSGRWGALRHYYRYLVYTPCTFLLFALIALCAITNQQGNSVYLTFMMGVVIVKICNIWYRDVEAYDYVVELVHSEEFRLHTYREAQHRRKAALGFARLNGCYAWGTFFAYLLVVIITMFVSDYEMPFDFWVPYDYHLPPYYGFSMAYQIVAMFFSSMSNGLLDPLTCYFMFHLSELYILLGMRLEALQDATDEQKIVAELKTLFKMHQTIKSLKSTCQSLVGIPIATQTILSALLLCFIGYRLTFINIGEHPIEFGVTLYLAAVMMLQIFLPCYYGSRVTTSADLLTAKVYSSNWSAWSPSTRKLIYIYMESLKKPVIIEAGNFFLVGLPVFVRTINNAYSLFALLLNMNQNN